MSKKNKLYRKSNPALVDIVIPVRGKHDFLKRCLEAIPDAIGDIPYKVWIVDNGSKPEDLSFYSTYPYNKFITTVFKFKNGLGYPGACNYGAKQGTAPLILILTHDVFLEPHAIEYMVKEMDNPTTGVVGIKLLFPEGSPHGPAGKVQHVGIELNIRAELYHQFIGWSPDNPKVLAKRESFAVTGALLMTRRSIWNKLKGFNSVYGLGTYEDCELCVDARKLGYNIRISQEAIGYHWVNASASDLGFSYPLNENKHIFMSRHHKDLSWEEWRYY